MTSFSARLDCLLTSVVSRGCSADDIMRLETMFQVTLPEDYKYFLEKCGRALGGYFVGTDWHFGELFDIQKHACDLLKDANAPEMPKGSFVFSMHQGYSFFYLNNEGVYFYLEGEQRAERRHESFADFFESACYEQGIPF